MLKENHGFTLIELVIVISIVGILAVIAIPIFMNLSTNAQAAALSSVAGSLSSANSNNYAARSGNNSLGNPVTNCTDVGNLLQGGLPTGYTITAGAVSVGATVSCTLTGLGGSTNTFNATGII